MARGQLPDGGRLADPVHARHQHDPRARTRRRLLHHAQDRLHLFLERLADIRSADAGPHARHQLGRGPDPDVGRDQRLLQLLERTLGLRGAASEGGLQLRRQPTSRREETLAEPVDRRHRRPRRDLCTTPPARPQVGDHEAQRHERRPGDDDPRRLHATADDYAAARRRTDTTFDTPACSMVMP